MRRPAAGLGVLLLSAGTAGCQGGAHTRRPLPDPPPAVKADGPQRVLLDQMHDMAVDDASAVRR